MRQNRSGRGWLAIAGSVGLHACLAAFMVMRPPAPRSLSVAPAEVSLHWVDVVAQVQAPAAPTPARAPTRPKAERTRTEAGAERGETTTPAEGPPSLPSGQIADAPYAAAAARQTSAPSKWAPGLGVVMQMPAAADAEGPRGQTIRNDATERPDEVALHEYEGEQLSRRLNDEISQDLARAMAGAGHVPPFFKRVEKSMREAVPHHAVARSATSTGDKVRDVASIFAPGVSMESANKVADSPLGQAVARNVGTGANVDEQRFRESALQMMAQAQTYVDRASAVRLRTVLELTQDARGVLADVRVVEKSGDPVFDDSVMHFSRKVVRDLPDSDEQGLGTKWWRSRWQFTWEPPNVRVRLMQAWPFAAPVQ